MKTKGIRLRWLYEACYEIVLPNGTTILTDPDLTIHKLPLAASDLTRVDYILCTHTHFDHTSDIGYLVEKFGCKLLVGQLSAQHLCRFFDLPYASVYPVAPDDVYEFDDVYFHFFRGKHTAIPDPSKGRPESTLLTTKNRFQIDGHEYCDQYGWLEFFDFVIVAPNNQSILFCGGIPAYKKAEEMARQYRPDILIRQSSGFENAEGYAELIDRFHAQVTFPSHHENIGRKMNMPPEQFMEETKAALQNRKSLTTFVNPEQFRWYEIATQVALTD